MGKGPKTVTRSGHAGVGKSKTISSATVAASTSGERFTWTAKMLDESVGGDDHCDWSWHLEPAELKELLEFLAQCSRRTWAELESDLTGGRDRHKKHHSQPVSSLCKAARDRFYDHVADESYDTMFRLRYGGAKRLWGVRDRSEFHIVWADLKHRVYPAEPN